MIGTPIKATITIIRRIPVDDKVIILSVMAFHTGNNLSSGTSSVSQRLATTGKTVTATTNDIHTAIAMVKAKSAKSCPSTSFKNITGIKIATVVAVDAIKAPKTSLVAI